MAIKIPVSKWIDIDSNFTLNSNGEISLVKDIDAVMSSMDNILGIFLGERVMLPEFPGFLRHLLFELLDEITISRASDTIKNTIERWDDRVTVNIIDFYADPPTNYLALTIQFLVRGHTLNLFTFTKQLF